nr:atherin-like [Camelus dromedarius]XP_031312117.1 atherin-like [Camelus dromedarius]
MVSETPATARLSHVGHRRAPTLSNQIAGKDRQTCGGLGGSGLLLPASWEVTGIRTCWAAAVAAALQPRPHTYLHSLGAHAAPRAAPPAETRPGPAGAAAAASQRRRASGIWPRVAPPPLPAPARPTPPSAAAADARSPASSARRLRGVTEARDARLPARPRPLCARRCGGPRAGAGRGLAGASGLRGTGRRGGAAAAAAAACAVEPGPRRVLQRRCPSPSPRCVNPPTTNPSTCSPPPPSQSVNFFRPGRVWC